MAVWSDATIERYKERGEKEFCSTHPCIVARVAPAITAGTAVYTLSDYILNIRRVTWKGKKLDPIPYREFRENSFSEESSGVPRAYVFSHTNINQIRLFPTPSESLAAETGDLFNADQILTSCVIEYWSMPDHIDLTIPDFLRRRLLKMYVNKQLFALEGRGKSNRNVKYYAELWEKLHTDYAQILSDLMNKPRKLVNGDPVSAHVAGYKKPILPSNYGYGVDI